MGFLYNDIKAEAKAKPKNTRPRGVIPIQSLNRLGCSVCPRDKDSLATPKMEPSGSPDPLLYVLTYGPSERDDKAQHYLSDKVGKHLERLLPRDSGEWTRFGGVIQCATDHNAPAAHEVECCRPRVVADIERTKPRVILGIGDAALGWATKLDAYSPRWRGRFMVVKIGSHVCWYFCVMFPSFVFKEQSKYGPDEREVAFKHDIEVLLAEMDHLPEPEYHEGPYDAGIEYITGNEAGDLDRLKAALERLAREPRVGLDIETTALRPYPSGFKRKVVEQQVLCCTVNTFEYGVAFILDHEDGWAGSPFLRRQAWSLFIEFLLNSGVKECHHLGFEMEWLAVFIDVRILRLTEWDDTMSMAHTIDERSGTKSLEVNTIVYFGFNLKKQSRVDVSRPRWWKEYPLLEILRYNGMDGKWTNKLSRTLRPILARDKKNQWAHDRKVRLAPTLVITQMRGLPLDIAYAEKLETEMDGKILDIEERLAACSEVKQYARKYGTFSPTNNDHVLVLMRDICQRDEVLTEDREGNRKETTNEEALALIPKDEVPSAALILEHRGIEKISSTYLRPITNRKFVYPDDMLHCSYSSMTAETGRLAAEDPNAQNWPVRKHREVRGIIYVGNGRWIVAFDYGQIEFRVAGMASGDENLIKACWTGYDVHGYWAGRMVQEYPAIKDWIVSEFEVDWDEKGLKTLRQEAKNKWVFPSIFGASMHSRGANLHLPKDVTQRLDAEFWDDFPDVKKWQKRTIAFYEKHLYVETLGGIRRHGPLTTNQIINMPIQGTAAEIVTEGMCAVSEMAVLEDDMDMHPMLNVHDDLTFNMPDEGLERRIARIATEMCRPRFRYINVPLIVEVKVGDRWSKMEEIQVFRSNELFNTPNPYKD